MSSDSKVGSAPMPLADGSSAGAANAAGLGAGDPGAATAIDVAARDKAAHAKVAHGLAAAGKGGTFTRHRAGSLLKILGQKPGQDFEEEQKQHNLSNRQYFQPKALFCIKRDNPFRSRCIKIAKNPWFDRIVVFFIILNCIVLSLMDPLDAAGTSWRNRIVEESELVFTVVFTVEMVIKIMAMGFVGKASYLADRWNWIDFTVVVVGWVSMLVSDADSVSSLRTFRVLRPLRTLSAIPQMAVIVKSMLASIPALFNVFLLCVFIFFIFGIIGVQIWTGVLRGRCYYTHPMTGESIMESADTLCPLPCAADEVSCTATFADPCGTVDVGYANGSAWQVASIQMVCKEYMNPRNDLVGFDNIGQACLTIFSSITLEGWVDTMYWLNATWGLAPVTAIYFILLIMFGSFFLLNLALAVIWDEYVKATEAQEIEIEEALLTARSDASHKEAALHAQQASHNVAGTDAAIAAASDASAAAAAAAAASGAATASDVAHSGAGHAGAGAAGHSTASDDATAASRAGGGGGDGPDEGAGGGRPRASDTRPLADPDAAAGAQLEVSPGGAGSSSSQRKLLESGDMTLAITADGMTTLGDDGDDDEPPPTLFGGCCYRNKRHGCLYYFVESKAFNLFIITIIMANTLTLALEHHEMDATFELVLRVLNLVFTGIFTVEMILKLIGLTPCGYVKSSWNTFDGFIVIVSLIEIVLDLAQLETGGGLSALRSFRLMRVLRLARSWKDLRNLLATIIKSIKEVANASVVLLIVMFIFCLLGMQLFGAKMPAEAFSSGVKPRAHFDNLWWSFVTVFQVLTGENWNEVMYATVEATGSSAIVFFLLLNIVGNYLILNLFLAILLGNFDSATDDDDEEEEAAADAEADGGNVHGDLKSSKVTPHAPDELGEVALSPGSGLPATMPPAQAARYRLRDADAKDGAVAGVGPGGAVLVVPEHAGADAGAGDPAAARAAEAKQVWQGERERDAGGASKPGSATTSRPGSSSNGLGGAAGSGSGSGMGGAAGSGAGGGAGGGEGSASAALVTVGGGGSGAEGSHSDTEELLPAQCPCCPNSGISRSCGHLMRNTFFILSPTNPLRLACARVIKHRFFDPFILLLICVSTVLLAMDEPRIETCGKLPASDPDSCITLGTFLSTADLVITILFCIEMTLKIVSMGFVLGKKDYLRNNWNVLDFAIVVISIASLILGDATQLKALRSLRALRALRPLRVVSRYPGLRLVVNSIFGALPKVSNVMLVNGLFFLIFGIIGVQNWMGALNSCNDESIVEMADCVGTYKLYGEGCQLLPTEPQIEACRVANGTDFPRVWQPPAANFDNTGNALLTVFEVASGEMWPDIMYRSVDAVGVNQPMERDASPVAALYFILINVVCAFFMLEIFTGVVIDNFNKMKEASEGAALLTEDQQMWLETMKLMLMTAPRRRMRKPSYRWRHPFFRLASWKHFEMTVMVLIGLNTVMMALRHYQQGPTWDTILEVGNLVFAILFAIEAVIKLLAFGFSQYFSVGWNRFDFFLVIASFLGELVNLGQLATLLRIVRVARIFRLIRTSRGLQVMFKTLLFSMPQLANVGAVLILIFFIYAIVGMNLFADIKYGVFLNEDANFKSFFRSMITLFRMSTGESYNGLMHDCMVQEPYCNADENCGFPEFAPIYFVSFYVLSAFILLNLLVAIILDNFADTIALDEGRSGFVLNDQDMNAFQAIWSRFDPSATKFIAASKMINVLLELPYPLGLKDTPGINADTTLRKQARQTLIEMAIPEHEGRVFFHEVLQALAARACGNISIDQPIPLLKDLENQKHRIMRSVAKANAHSVSEHMAAELLQSTYRGHRLRRAADSSAGPMDDMQDSMASEETGADSTTVEPIALAGDGAGSAAGSGAGSTGKNNNSSSNSNNNNNSTAGAGSGAASAAAAAKQHAAEEKHSLVHDVAVAEVDNDDMGVLLDADVSSTRT